MAKERTPREILESESLFSGPAQAVKGEMRLFQTYHAFDILKEIDEYLRLRNSADNPQRSVLIVSDPLHFDELDYFRYHFGKLYGQQVFDYMKRWKEARTSVELSLTYNRPTDDAVSQEGQQTLAIAAFPGLGYSLDLSRIVNGEHVTLSQRQFAHADLRLDPESLNDTAWQMVRENRPPVK